MQQETPERKEVQQGWPDSLTHFVNGSFARLEQLPEHLKPQFAIEINEIIQMAINLALVWTNQWEKQELPVFSGKFPLSLVGPPQLQQRKRKDKQHDSNGKYDSSERKKQRMERFGDAVTSVPSLSSAPMPSTGPIVGRLQALEKRYLRLTSEPNPDVVRPEAVLERCVPFVYEKYETGQALYAYLNDQMKAIRQDLTVQHIKNEFSILVYLTHAKVALDNNDLGEFNQCMSQMSQLFKELIPQNPKLIFQTYEFTVYKILYFLLTKNYSQVDFLRLEFAEMERNKGDMKPPKEAQTYHQFVLVTFDLALYVIRGDFYAFFDTVRSLMADEKYKRALRMISQFLAPKLRVMALDTLCKAFKKLPVPRIKHMLALEDDSWAEFAANYKLEGFVQGDVYDCAASRAVLTQILLDGNFKRIDIKGQV